METDRQTMVRALAACIVAGGITLGADARADEAPPPQPSGTAPETRVPLRNGTTLTGTMVSEEPGSYLMLQVPSGWTLTVPWQQIGAPPRARRVPTGPAADATHAAPSPSNPGRTWGWVIFLTGYAGGVAGVAIGCGESGAHCDRNGQIPKSLIPVIGPYLAFDATTSFSKDERSTAQALALVSAGVQALGLGLVLFSKPSAPDAAAPPKASSAPLRLDASALPGGGFAGLSGAF